MFRGFFGAFWSFPKSRNLWKLRCSNTDGQFKILAVGSLEGRLTNKTLLPLLLPHSCYKYGN